MSASTDFIGIYVLPDREIRIDGETSREDLMLVIRKLMENSLSHNRFLQELAAHPLLRR